MSTREDPQLPPLGKADKSPKLKKSALVRRSVIPAPVKISDSETSPAAPGGNVYGGERMRQQSPVPPPGEKPSYFARTGSSRGRFPGVPGSVSSLGGSGSTVSGHAGSSVASQNIGSPGYGSYNNVSMYRSMNTAAHSRYFTQQSQADSSPAQSPHPNGGKTDFPEPASVIAEKEPVVMTSVDKAANDRGTPKDDKVLLNQIMQQFSPYIEDEYLILRQMYKSSASHVHLAVRKNDEENVVLKFLPAHTKVRHEIKALNAVQGLPGTVQLLEVLKTDDEIVLVMAEVKAKSRHYAPETLAHLKRYMRQLLETLARLHSLGIIHRDIKESNALMSDRVVVIDFGLAVIANTCVGQAGTKGYIAPELQIKGGVGTNKIDVFSSAVVVVQMMLGIHLRGLRDAHSLRSCRNKEEVVSWIQQRFPSWDKLEKLEALFDDNLFSLLRAMLSFDADERPSCRQALQHMAFTQT